MSKRISLEGKRFGKLTVVEFAYSTPHTTHWKCRCDCGRFKVTRSDTLRIGRTTHCGCSHGRITHGLTRAGKWRPEYAAWRDMIRRCYDSKCPSFIRYGAIGVEVTPAWLGKRGLKNFLRDMGPRPDGMSLDRINPFGNYRKGNCRWADAETQMKNKRRNWMGRRRLG